jgi:hypothetical protein
VKAVPDCSSEQAKGARPPSPFSPPHLPSLSPTKIFLPPHSDAPTLSAYFTTLLSSQLGPLPLGANHLLILTSWCAVVCVYFRVVRDYVSAVCTCEVWPCALYTRHPHTTPHTHTSAKPLIRALYITLLRSPHTLSLHTLCRRKRGREARRVPTC